MRASAQHSNRRLNDVREGIEVGQKKLLQIEKFKLVGRSRIVKTKEGLRGLVRIGKWFFPQPYRLL